MNTDRTVINQLNRRSRDIFGAIVESFVANGEPIGSKTLSKKLKVDISPSTVRNVMADLEKAGLLYSPHTSAGRLPTEAGLRIFVDGLLEMGNITTEDRESLEKQLAGTGNSFESVLESATNTLSGLSNCAGVVCAPKLDAPLKHIEFVYLNPGQALVVLVTADGVVENRILEVPADIPPSVFIEASNFLNAKLIGKTITDASTAIKKEIDENKELIHTLTSSLLKAGLATWSENEKEQTLIVSGHSNLLDDVNAMTDLENVRKLFSALETTELTLKVLELVDLGEGVQIFIGADNDLFNLAGCSFIVAPYNSGENKLLGAIGVIGPSRMNYARIIPMVDYTAKILNRYIR